MAVKVSANTKPVRPRPRVDDRRLPYSGVKDNVRKRPILKTKVSVRESKPVITKISAHPPRPKDTSKKFLSVMLNEIPYTPVVIFHNGDNYESIIKKMNETSCRPFNVVAIGPKHVEASLSIISKFPKPGLIHRILGNTAIGFLIVMSGKSNIIEGWDKIENASTLRRNKILILGSSGYNDNQTEFEKNLGALDI
jgi:hypothetical protein